MATVTDEEFDALMQLDPHKYGTAYAQMDRRIQFGILKQLESLNEKMSTFEPVKITQVQGALTKPETPKRTEKKTVKG